MRTICPGEGCREHPKKQNCRCGNDSVAAAFLWSDSEKALKSRTFGQNEKVGNFYQNYLPFMAEMERFSRLRPKSRLRRLASDTPACGQPSRTALRAARALTLPLPPNKKPRPTGRGFVWRRWRDSNSRRAFDPTISNRARSTNYATSPRVCSRRPYQLVSLPIIMHKMGKVKHDFIRFPLLLADSFHPSCKQ